MSPVLSRRCGFGRGACVAALLVTVVSTSACGVGSSSRPSAALGGGGSGCNSSAAGSPQRGGTLTFARFQDPTTVVPNNGIPDNPSIQTEEQIYDELLELRPCQSKPGPGLAKSWSTSRDGLTWTFHLRPARFSDGRPVTSADVLYSYGRVMNPNIDSNFASSFQLFIKSITAPDPHTVVIRLKHPYAGLPYWLAFNVTSIVSKVDFERLGAKGYAAHPIGSGPFELQSWQHGNRLVLVRNPYYWQKGLPYLDKVVLETIPSDNTRVLDVQSGQVDLADDLPFSQLPTLESNPKLSVVTGPGTLFALTINTKKHPLDELSVRQALNYALPKTQINQVVFKGRGQIANSAWPLLPGWSGAGQPYPYDIAKAKALLAHSSVPHGFSIQFAIVGTDETSVTAAQIIQQAWAKIGVRAQLAQSDQATVFNDIVNGNTAITLMPPSVWSSDIAAGDELALLMATGLGAQAFGYNSPTFNALVNHLMSAGTDYQRNKIIPQVERRLFNDATWGPIVFSPVRAALQKNVHGFGYTPTNTWALDSVWLSH